MHLPIALAFALIATPATAWEIHTAKDRMTDRMETWATMRSDDSTLYVGCMNGSVQPRLTWDRRIGYGDVGASYRFDDGPVVPRFGFVGSDGTQLYLWPMDYGEAMTKLRKGKRLRVQIGQNFYDFDLTKGDRLPAINCAKS